MPQSANLSPSLSAQMIVQPCPDFDTSSDLNMDHENINQTAHLKRDHDAANATDCLSPDLAASAPHLVSQPTLSVPTTQGSSLLAAVQIEQMDETLMEGRQEVWNNAGNVGDDLSILSIEEFD